VKLYVASYDPCFIVQSMIKGLYHPHCQLIRLKMFCPTIYYENGDYTSNPHLRNPNLSPGWGWYIKRDNEVIQVLFSQKEDLRMIYALIFWGYSMGTPSIQPLVSPHGNLMKIFCNGEMMALHVSCTIMHSVHHATRNKYAIFLYS